MCKHVFKLAKVLFCQKGKIFVTYFSPVHVIGPLQFSDLHSVDISLYNQKSWFAWSTQKKKIFRIGKPRLGRSLDVTTNRISFASLGQAVIWTFPCTLFLRISFKENVVNTIVFIVWVSIFYQSSACKDANHLSSRTVGEETACKENAKPLQTR